MSRPLVVNRSGVVIGDDGKRLYGMDAELHLKMKAKEDPEWEKQVGRWVAEVTGEKIDDGKLQAALEDGQTLIKLINTLKPGTIEKWNKIDPNSKMPTALAATGNIRLYLAAAQQLGVPGVDMFLVDDLRMGRAMTMVCRNLASLSRIAQRDLGWKGGIIGPRLSTQGPKIWSDVEFKPYQQPEETPQSELEEMLLMYKGLLEKERQDLIQSISREGHLRHEVDKLKSAIKEYRIQHEAFLEHCKSVPSLHTGAVREFTAAIKLFGDPNMPDHLQPVEKTDKDELEQKRLRKHKKLQEEKHHHRTSSSNLQEWQEQVKKKQAAIDYKRQRRLSFGKIDETQEAEEERNDELLGDIEDQRALVTASDTAPLVEGEVRQRLSPSGHRMVGTPSKERRGQQGVGGVSRRTLVVIMVVEAIVLLGLAGGFAWSMWNCFG